MDWLIDWYIWMYALIKNNEEGGMVLLGDESHKGDTRSRASLCMALEDPPFPTPPHRLLLLYRDLIYAPSNPIFFSLPFSFSLF